jgi:hypothetical protein
LLDNVVPAGTVAPTATVTLANVSVADTVTIAGVEITAAGAADLPNQVFAQNGTDIQDATSFVAAVQHAATQALITAALGGGRTITATNGGGTLAVVTLTAGGSDNTYLTEGTVVSSNGTRLAVSSAVLTKATMAWSAADLAEAAAALIARVDAGQALAASNINTVLAAVVAGTSLTGGGSTATVADILSILAGREYFLPKGSQVLVAADLPLTIFNTVVQGSFTRTRTVWDSQMVQGEIRPLLATGDTESVERKPIRGTVDGTSFQMSLSAGYLARFTAGVTLFPDSDVQNFIPSQYQKALTVSGVNLASQRLVTVYADDGTLIA